MNLPLSDLVFQNNGSGQMCHVLGHGNLPKKQQQQINFLLTPYLKKQLQYTGVCWYLPSNQPSGCEFHQNHDHNEQNHY